MAQEFFCDTSLPEFSHSLSLDASGGSASRNLLGAAKGALIRAAASTQPLGRLPEYEKIVLFYLRGLASLRLLQVGND